MIVFRHYTFELERTGDEAGGDGNIGDVYTREELAIDVAQGIKGDQMVDAMNRISAVRGTPRAIRVHNGPEFISKVLDQ